MICAKCNRTIAKNESYYRTKNRTPFHRKRPLPKLYINREEREIDEVATVLYNLGATLAGNTQGTDIEWFGRWLYGASNFGMGDSRTMGWSLTNSDFEKLGLKPNRFWTGKRWETLERPEREAWNKLARLCLYALPHIAERIGCRFMEQAKSLRILHEMAEAKPQNAPGERRRADDARLG